MTATRLVLSLMLALLVAPDAPAAADVPRAARRERIELRVTFSSWDAGGSFRLETSGGKADHGVVRDQGGFSAAGGAVRRVVEGEKGTLVLWLQGQTRAGLPPVFGRWTIASGTGIWAGATGGGTFTAMDAGARRGGHPHELQFLVGSIAHGQ